MTTNETEMGFALIESPAPRVNYALSGGEIGPLESWAHAEALIASLASRLALLSSADQPTLRRAALITRRGMKFESELGIVRGTDYRVAIRERGRSIAANVLPVLELYFLDAGAVHLPARPQDGRIVVHTLRGPRYVVDLDLMLLRRLRNDTRPNNIQVPASVRLRRDTESLKILRIVNLCVGRPAVFDLLALGRGSVTRQTTTDVLLIERLL